MALVGAPIMTNGAAPAAKFANDRERACVIKSPPGPELEWKSCWDGSCNAFCCKASFCLFCCFPCVWQELFEKVAMPTHAKQQTKLLCMMLPLMFLCSALGTRRTRGPDGEMEFYQPLGAASDLISLASFLLWLFVLTPEHLRMRKFLSETFGWERAAQQSGSCGEYVCACIFLPCFLCGAKATIDERAIRLQAMGLHDGMPIENVMAMHMKGAAPMMVPVMPAPVAAAPAQNYGAVAPPPPPAVAPMYPGAGAPPAPPAGQDQYRTAGY